jgi:flagellin
VRINQNITAFNAYRNLSQTQGAQSKSLEKLSSGFRINRAADDAAGLVNSENLRAQIGGLKVATRNAQDAISLVQTAEGAMTEVHSVLQRMRDLVVQSGNLGTNDSQALQANQDEIGQLQNELNRIANQTQFGTKKILEGTRTIGETVTGAPGAASSGNLGTQVFGTQAALLGAVDTAFGLAGGTTTVESLRNVEVTQAGGVKTTLHAIFHNANGTYNAAATLGSGDRVSVITGGNTSFQFQVGANATQNEAVTINGVNATTLGVDTINVTTVAATPANIDTYLTALDSAIQNVSGNRANLGAFQNRMESLTRNISVAVENLSAAESRIRDTDMAQEMVSFTRSQILAQAGTAMLAQANQVPQSVLSLLR